MTTRKSKAILWAGFLSMIAIKLMVSDELSAMPSGAIIFFTLAIVEALLAGALIVRAGLVSFETPALVVIYLATHKSLLEVIIFTSAVLYYGLILGRNVAP